MKQYQLTEQEARALAGQIALEMNKINNPDVKYEVWFPTYMNTYNRVMNAIDEYNKKSQS